MAAAVCVERGWLDYDGVVAEYWPEFAAAGKEEVTVAQLLSHQAGLAAIDGAVRLEEILDWDHMATRVAKQAPLWEPGSAHGYHALTFGWLAGELVHRADPQRRSLGAFVADEVAGPVGAEAFIGLPEDLEHRVSPLVLSALLADPGVAALGPPDARPRDPSRAGPYAERGRSLRRSRLEHPSGARRADPGRQRHQHGVVAGPRLRRLRRRGRRPATARPGHDRQSERDDHAGRGARPGTRGADDVRHGFHDLGPVHADAGAGILRTRGGRRLAGLRRTPRPRSASPTP